MKKLLPLLCLFWLSISYGNSGQIVTTLNCVGQDSDRYEFQIHFTETWLLVSGRQATALIFLNDKIFYESGNGRFKHELSRITGRLTITDKITGIVQTPFICSNSTRQF